MPSLTPTVYIPIEEVNRELDAKLLVAGALLGRGISVVMGRQAMLTVNFPHLPPGIVLFKGMNAMPAHLMRGIGAYGHLSVGADEDSLGLSDIGAIARNLDPSIGDVCERFLAQGEVQREAIEKTIPGAGPKTRIVGNARLDLLRPPFRDLFAGDAERNRRQHGRYVLFDGNFGAINSRWGSVDRFAEVLARVGWMNPDDQGDRAYFERRVRTEQANIVIFRRTLEALADRYPDVCFIVRPHPAERIEPWQRAYEGQRGNIQVISEGSVVPWLLGAALVVHAGCTTGLEAEILGVPALAILPETAEELLNHELISYIANERAVGAPAAVAAASAVLDGGDTPVLSNRAARQVALQPYIAGLDGRFAFQATVEELTELVRAGGGCVSREFIWRPDFPGHLVRTREAYEAKVAGLRGASYSWSKAHIDETTICLRLERIVGKLGVPAEYGFEIVGDGLFVFRPGDKARSGSVANA
jgi:surface carbohydrate biosynthesis protein